MTVYCYAPQLRAIMTLLANAGLNPNSVVATNDGRVLRQSRSNSFAFVRVSGHPSDVPREIEALLVERGATTFTIDDSLARLRYNADRDAARRNRDEHGPDIPAQSNDPDWRKPL